MNNITWIDLYQFLCERANDMKNLGSFDWSAPVIVYDTENGDEFDCSMMYLDNRFSIMINLAKEMSE